MDLLPGSTRNVQWSQVCNLENYRNTTDRSVAICNGWDRLSYSPSKYFPRVWPPTCFPLDKTFNKLPTGCTPRPIPHNIDASLPLVRYLYIPSLIFVQIHTDVSSLLLPRRGEKDRETRHLFSSSFLLSPSRMSNFFKVNMERGGRGAEAIIKEREER